MGPRFPPSLTLRRAWASTRRSDFAKTGREDDGRWQAYAWLAALLPSAACAAASRAIGTRNGEHDT